MYLRFVNFLQVKGMKAREGFLQVAYDLVRRNDIDVATLRSTNNLLQWFADNLDAPDRVSKVRKKNYDRNTKGLSWFKPTATEHIKRAFQMKTLLEENGYPVEVLKSKRLGYILFEDERGGRKISDQ